MSDKEAVVIGTIGHVNGGKSTLCGRFLFELGAVRGGDLLKLRKEAQRLGKESYLFAFCMDRSSSERAQGLTIDYTIGVFFTTNYHYTLFDLPGHRKFTKNMITGASQCDVALLVVSAKKDEFEESMKPNGQTVQHLIISHALGIQQMVVCVNKMDDPSVDYKEDVFNEVKSKLTQLLTSIGYDTKQIPFIPISAWEGSNLIEHSSAKMELMDWYEGFRGNVFTLLDALDNVIKKPQRFVQGVPARMYLRQSFQIKGVGNVMCGVMQQGCIKPGMSITYEPNHKKGKLFSIETHHRTIESARSGQDVGLCIKALVKDNFPKTGDLMITDVNPELKQEHMMNVNHFVASVLVQYHPTKIKIGYQVSMHIVTKRVQCQIVTIRWKKGKSTEGKVIQYPEYLETGDTAEVIFESRSLVTIYPFEEGYNPRLTKIIGLDYNRVIMFGKINDDSYDFYNHALVRGYIRKEIEQKYELHIARVIQEQITHFSLKFETADSTLGGMIIWKKVADFSALLPRDVKLKLWNGVFKAESDYKQPEVKRISKVLRTFVMLQLTREYKKTNSTVPNSLKVQLPGAVKEPSKFIASFLKRDETSIDETFLSIHETLCDRFQTDDNAKKAKYAKKLKMTKDNYVALTKSDLQREFNKEDFLKAAFLQYMLYAYQATLDGEN
eukprot:952546_1